MAGLPEAAQIAKRAATIRRFEKRCFLKKRRFCEGGMGP
jgi:hypothetical protein